MEKLSGVYKIESIIYPDRIYIGSSYNINKRRIQHLSDLKLNKHRSVKLQRHYNKYGQNDLKYSIMLICEKENLITNEQKFIDELNPYFNICKIAGSTLGNKWNDESKAKISKIHKGKIPWNLGVKHSVEACEKMRVAAYGRISPNRGKTLSIETKNKISTSQKLRLSKKNM